MQINSATTTAWMSDDAPVKRRPAQSDAAQTDDTPLDASTTDASADTSTQDASTDATQAQDPSSVKSFAYGALGLERPEVQATDTNGFYTAGKWVAAAATVGGIISLFV